MAETKRAGRRTAARGWSAVVLQTARDLYAGSAAEWAAALAFYGVLSAFPLLMAGVVLASFVADAAWAEERIVALLEQFLPPGEIDVAAIVEQALANRTEVGLIAVAALLVTGRRVFGALTTALDLVSDVDARTDPLRRRALVEVALLIGVVLLFVLALSSRLLLELAWETARAAPAPPETVFWALKTIVRTAFLLVAFVLIYEVVPRGKRNRRATLAGAMVATALFLLAQAVFGAVIGRLWDTLSLVYGPLAIATVLLLWAWYVALITLVGGSLASHVKVMLFEGADAEEAERRHVAHV